jgi:peptide/nickel transport system substrate-binding protein
LATFLTALLPPHPAVAAPVAAQRVLRVVTGSPVQTLDPQAILASEVLQYSHLVFDPLVRWTRDMTFEPRLAERWERIDANTLRLFLRPGVRFHGGNPCTARDVAWTLERLRASPDFKGLFAPIDRVEVIDDFTVDLHTAQPCPLLLNLATYVFPMDSRFYSGTDQETGRPRDAIAGHAPTFAGLHESGTGPFRVAGRRPDGALVLRRFAGHWDTASPGNVDEIVLGGRLDAAARMDALFSGAADLVTPVPPEAYARVEADPRFTLTTLRGTRLIALFLDERSRPQFADPRVRRAVNLAVDNQAIVAGVLQGRATPAAQCSPPGFAGHVADLLPRFDLELARELMRQAGLEKGFDCTMIATGGSYVNGEDVARAFVRMMAAINIRVQLTLLPRKGYGGAFHAHSADIQMLGWHPDTEDSANYFEMLLMCPDEATGHGRFNSGGYCNPRLDEAVRGAHVEIDMKARAELLRRAERIAHQDAAFVPLHWQHLSWAARKDVDLAPVVNEMEFPYLGDLVLH